ncbi:hypothetical protein Rs2_50038 [Raphanus sativus]|nr:hypothetical protein Rs2_50038 [Raphanus sativus]
MPAVSSAIPIQPSKTVVSSVKVDKVIGDMVSKNRSVAKFLGRRFWSRGRNVKKKGRVSYSFAEDELKRKAQDSSTGLWYVTSGFSVNIFAKADDFQNQAHSHEDYSRRFKPKGSIFAKANDFQNQAQPPEDFASRFEPKILQSAEKPQNNVELSNSTPLPPSKPTLQLLAQLPITSNNMRRQRSGSFYKHPHLKTRIFEGAIKRSISGKINIKTEDFCALSMRNNVGALVKHVLEPSPEKLMESLWHSM